MFDYVNLKIKALIVIPTARTRSRVEYVITSAWVFVLKISFALNFNLRVCYFD